MCAGCPPTRVLACVLWSGLLKYEVVCSQLGLLGSIYLDLVARPGKVPSSGILYPVRCGRELPGESLLLLLLVVVVVGWWTGDFVNVKICE
jgi:hypothetical protein